MWSFIMCSNLICNQLKIDQYIHRLILREPHGNCIAKTSHPPLDGRFCCDFLRPYLPLQWQLPQFPLHPVQQDLPDFLSRIIFLRMAKTITARTPRIRRSPMFTPFLRPCAS